ncbi:gluconokinase [Gorillibacterium massiliense]|uniref:gluconokinase n=1 Tax=Gorillibacterium massiliense TaxID=1280390 RepID=UPI0005926D12|nr:gluconokinase [Gorillibacterium massiliense]
MTTTSKPYVIAADLGTTSTKTLVVDDKGTILASHAILYPMYTPTPDIAEQDPQEIYQAVLRGIREVIRKAGIRGEDVLAVSFSSAMHSLMAVDEKGEPLTPLITWADNRSAAYTARLKKEPTGREIYHRTGTPVHPMSPLAKLMWMRDQEPDLFAKAYKFIGIKEFVFAKLFGRYVVDHSIASATGLFNLHQLDWDELALATAGVDAVRLSVPVPAGHAETGLPAALAAEMGLPADTPFVVGGADGPLANLGAGAVEPGVWALTVGTSGAVRGIIREPRTDAKGRLFCYALADGYWTVGGAINNGGVMFRWVRDTLATLEAEEGRRKGMDPYDYLTELAHTVPPGSGGLLFLPFLLGERSPNWNANARGVFFGLAMNHTKNHMIRAVMEGVVYRLNSVAQALSETIGAPEEIRASGGFARSPLWRQMLADVLVKTVTVTDSVESSALGAAYIGFYAMGRFSRLEDIRDWVVARTSHRANSENYPIYKELTNIYARVYDQLIGEFDAIAELQHRSMP